MCRFSGSNSKAPFSNERGVARSSCGGDSDCTNVRPKDLGRTTSMERPTFHPAVSLQSLDIAHQCSKLRRQQAPGFVSL